MEFRILGPLEVRSNGQSLPLGGPKQRAVLALLLLGANRVVSRERLIAELWPDAPGRDSEHALTLQISRLRKALSAAGDGGERVVTRAPGYVLRVERDELDLDRYERLVAAGRTALEAGDAESAVARLRAAESLWRGRPLADLEFEPFARLDVERLEELRLAALEERIEAELATGRHHQLVPELEGLVAEHPLRERLRAQLMRATMRARARPKRSPSIPIRGACSSTSWASSRARRSASSSARSSTRMRVFWLDSRHRPCRRHAMKRASRAGARGVAARSCCSGFLRWAPRSSG